MLVNWISLKLDEVFQMKLSFAKKMQIQEDWNILQICVKFTELFGGN